MARKSDHDNSGMGRGIRDNRDEGTIVRKDDKNDWTQFRNGKVRGEWAELKFAAEAVRRGLRLNRPWGESSGYDFTVDGDSGAILRVQVKSTMFRVGNGYSCTMKNSRGPYAANAFDFVAAYVIPEDTWFILPAKVMRGRWSVSLYPGRRGLKYGAFEEAWELLGARGRDSGPDRIFACADEIAEELVRHGMVDAESFRG